MKQVVLASIFLVAVLAVGIVSSMVTASLSDKIVSELERARLSIKGDNWNNAEESVGVALERWEKSRNALGLIASDDELAATDAAFASVESALEYRESMELDMHIRIAELLIEAISQREALYWHNFG